MACGGEQQAAVAADFRLRRASEKLDPAVRRAVMPLLALHAFDPLGRNSAMAALGAVLGALIHDAAVSGEVDPRMAEANAAAALQAFKSAFEERARGGALLGAFVLERDS